MTNPFASKQAEIVQAAAPTPTPPPTMPDPQSADALAAKRRVIEDVMGRAGRSSTILTSAFSRGDSSGGYGSTKLGSGT